MTTDVEVEEFLEHFGIKGMRWGVRNEKKVSEPKIKKKLSPKAKKRIIMGSAFAATLVATGITLALMKKRRKLPSVKKPFDKNSAEEGLRDLYKKGIIKDGRWIVDERGRKAQPKPDWWDESELGSWLINRARKDIFDD